MYIKGFDKDLKCRGFINGNNNSGHENSGNNNSGDGNSGDFNSGDFNSGDGNSGYWNKCDGSNGVFCIEEPTIKIFDKDNMIFGETNLIMTFFDHICDYIFGDFITTYNVLDTLFKSFIQ